jgi:phosphatidate cytidylyltransferase
MCLYHNLITRTLSGAVFVTVVIGSILLHPYAYAVMMAGVVVWALLELNDIINKDSIHTGKYIDVLCGVSLFAFSFFYAQGLITAKVFLLFIPLLTFLFISLLYSKNHHSFRSIANSIASVVYIALPFSLCNGLVFPSGDGGFLNPDGKYVPDILLGFFILLWTNDTFAYLTGIMFGRHRLFERISPKKSWEGFIGGLICTIALSLLVAKLFPILPFYHWMAVAAVIVVFGVYGDLIESLLKRNLKIKDSGRFLPGHGGILDRFDSVLLAVPMVFFYLKMFVF